MSHYTTHLRSTEFLADSWTEFVTGFAKWTAFVTLTFEQLDRTHNVTQTEAQFKFRRLVQALNTDLYGHHYTRIIGHSYFAYALAFENHKSGLLHMHALLDNRTNWKLIKQYWQGEKRPYRMGIAEIKRVDDLEKTAKYVCKYVTKGGEMVLYKPTKTKKPAYSPGWYLGL